MTATSQKISRQQAIDFAGVLCVREIISCCRQFHSEYIEFLKNEVALYGYADSQAELDRLVGARGIATA